MSNFKNDLREQLQESVKLLYSGDFISGEITDSGFYCDFDMTEPVTPDKVDAIAEWLSGRSMEMIRQLDPSAFSLAAGVIRVSYATVAEDLGLTEENCPKYVGFITTAERLQTQYNWGWWIYGLYDGDQIVGYVSISKQDDGAYEIHNLAVLPEHRHKGYGKQFLDFCVVKVRELGGSKINISIVEENTVLKNWYLEYGFVHTGTKKFDHLPFTSGYMELDVTL